MPTEHLHNMKAVSARTGLSAHLIRIWERRYGAVEPARSGSQRRLYSDADVHRLRLLSALTRQGFSIGQIAKVKCDQLMRMAKKHESEEQSQQSSLSNAPGSTGSCEDELINQAMEASKAYNAEEIERILDQAMVSLGACGVLERMLIRLLQRIGEQWAGGYLTSAQEHFASATIRDYLARHVRPMLLGANAPRLVVTTPEGQLHEMGAIIAAALARKSGWNVTYLGPSLPPEEIASACKTNGARALALSIIYPHDDPVLPEQLIRIRKLLPGETAIVIGGSQLNYYQRAIEEIGAHTISDLTEFSKVIRQIRDETRAEPE